MRWVFGLLFAGVVVEGCNPACVCEICEEERSNRVSTVEYWVDSEVNTVEIRYLNWTGAEGYVLVEKSALPWTHSITVTTGAHLMVYAKESGTWTSPPVSVRISVNGEIVDEVSGTYIAKVESVAP